MPWSPATHARFPPAFQAAARTLLLAAQRGAALAATTSHAAATTSNVGTVGLSRLPPDALQRILGLAAYPLSAWDPLPDGGHAWAALANGLPRGN